MKNKVILHGLLAEKYGKEFELEVDTPAEAIHFISKQVPGFAHDIRSGQWHVIKGAVDSSNALNSEGLYCAFGRSRELHIMPAMVGAGGAVGEILAVALPVFTLGTVSFSAGLAGSTMAVTSLGAVMASKGIADMLSYAPDTPSTNSKARVTGGWLYDGPINISGEGFTAPVAYGKCLVGSIVVSGGISTERVPIDPEE